MIKITYEEKMNYLDSKRNELIDRSKKYTSEVEYDKYMIDIIECIMEDVRDMHIINEEVEKFNKIEKKASDIYEELFLKWKMFLYLVIMMLVITGQFIMVE